MLQHFQGYEYIRKKRLGEERRDHPRGRLMDQVKEKVSVASYLEIKEMAIERDKWKIPQECNSYV